jgi:FdhD protein
MGSRLDQMEDRLGLHRLGYAGPLLEQPAVRWEGDQRTESVEQLVEETPVVLVYNGLPHVVMMATPADLEDFALGFSLTEELIGAPEDLQSLEIVQYGRGVEIKINVPPAAAEAIAGRTRRLSGRTGCGICGTDSIDAVLKHPHQVKAGKPVTPAAIHRALEQLAARQTLNAAAGAVHAAGWSDHGGTVELVREDVGRHNALDKLIGALTRRGLDPESGFLAITSRASFEMVQKAAVLGAPLLAAISGPTGLAVRVAHQSGMTLVGFARRGRLTVYTHADRVAP